MSKLNKNYWFKRRIMKDISNLAFEIYYMQGRLNHLSYDEFLEYRFPAFYKWITRNE